MTKSSYGSYIGAVKAVGIKNLKNHLSRYLKRVQEGETVSVTDRDEIMAEIHKPVRAPTGVLSRWEAYLNEEERKGTIIRAKRPVSTLQEDVKKLTPLPKGGPTLQEILDETRMDRSG